MSYREKDTLVMGVGNDLLMDDGVGPRLVQRLQKETNLPVDYTSVFLGGLDILEVVKDYLSVIIVDAIKTRGGTPGDVYLLTPEDFRETLHLTTFHDVSFLTSLEMGRKLGYNMPGTIDIIAVEIVEDTVFGKHFSLPLQKAWEQVYQQVLSFMEEKIANLPVNRK